MNSEFWHKKTVLISGHTGFKGSWLALWLQDLGAEVVGYSLAPPSEPSLYDAARVTEGMASVHGDLRDFAHLRAVVVEHRPEIVFHLGAQALVHEGYRDPLGTYSTNVMGTANILQAVRDCDSVRAVVSVTSDKCYANNEWVWGYREVDALGGKDPYSDSKACAELVTAAFRSAYFEREDEARRVRVATARAGNVIGGGDWAADRLVPDLIRGIQSGVPTRIRRPQATRPWQHVLEPLRGYLDLAEWLWNNGEEAASAWNFGPSETDARPVHWVADRVVELWGEGADWELDGASYAPEARYLKLDCSKSRQILGWIPALSAEEALAWSIEWYRKHYEGADARALTLDQIQRYQETTCTTVIPLPAVSAGCL